MTFAAPETQQSDSSQEAALGQTLHDLRTPLNQIIGLGEMLIEIATDEGHRDLLDGLNTVREAGMELSTLLQDRKLIAQEAQPGRDYWPLSDAARGAVSQVLGYTDLVLGEAQDARLESYRQDLANIRLAAQRFNDLARQSGLFICLETDRHWDASAGEIGGDSTISAALAGARILVVDDESLNREVLCRRLLREGCRATGANSGRDALVLLRAENFDAMLLDMRMPEMSGLEVLQALKADHKLRFLPVIMLSAHTEVDRVARCLELGAEDYLPKPINSVLLRARLGACLEKKKMAEELMRAGKLQSVGLLAGGLAHDFNNMLTTVLGNLSLLRFSEELSAKGRTCLEAAERGAVRAQELTRYLLTFAEGGAPAKESLHVRGMLEDSCQVFLRAADRQSDLHFPKDLWSLEADPHQLKQVVENILTNAVEATDARSTIHVEAANVRGPIAALGLGGEKYLRMSVRDEGSGIAATDLPRVFDPFFTTKKNARGLGLALAYSIVQRHGGHLELSSVPGQGTTATFYLPAVDVGSPEPAATAPAATPASPIAPAVAADDGTPRQRVLVMDDEPDIRDLIDTMLSLLGYDCVTTRKGEDALDAHEKARQEGKPFDIAIMDLTIPNGMGGAETMKRLRAKDSDIRTVVASGYSDDPVIAHHREYGFDSVLPKPYVMSDLMRTLEGLSRAR